MFFAAVVCAALPLIPHGSKACTGNKYGQHCAFTCDQGYDLQGSAKRTCQLDGTWTGTSSSCKGILRQAMILLTVISVSV